MTESPTRLERFDPRASLPLVLTLMGLLAITFIRLPWLGDLLDYPELRTREPVKALLQDSLLARSSVSLQQPIPAEWGCELCSSVGVRQAWDRLEMLLDMYGADAPPFVQRAVEAFPRARAISLGVWDDPTVREIVPNPAQALRELTRNRADPLFGVHPIAPSRIELLGWGWTLVDAVAMLLALVLFVRWRRRDRAPSPAPFGAAAALSVFFWSMGAAALLMYALPSTDSSPDWYPVPDAVVAVLIGSLALRGSSWRQLLRGLGFRSLHAKQVVGYMAVVVGAVALFGWAIALPLGALGHASPWPQASADLLIYGSNQDQLLHCVSLIVTGPLYEEAMFTGLLFGGLATRLSFRSSALITAAVFAGEHALDVVGTLDLMVGSIASCWAFWRTGSIWPSVLAHALLNALHASVVLY